MYIRKNDPLPPYYVGRKITNPGCLACSEMKKRTVYAGYIVPLYYLRTLSHSENNHTLFILGAWRDVNGQVLIRSASI